MITNSDYEVEQAQKHEDIRGYIYKYPEVLNYMFYKIDRVAHIVTRTDKLQFYIEHKVNNYIDGNGEDIPLMKSIVDKEVGKYLKGGYSTQRTVSLEQLSQENDYGEIIPFEVVDKVENYADIIAYDDGIRKMIALICKSDQENWILTELYRGSTEKEIAACLATELSIKPESAMKKINRVKTRNYDNVKKYYEIA